MSERHQDGCGCFQGCGAIASDRNRYFTGKYMTARDFRDEQHYFLSRQRLHNRTLHGWGVVCGLRVVRHRDPQCRDWIVVRAGIAIDCCGREIVLRKDTPFELPLADPDLAAGGDAQGAALDEPFLLCIGYRERLIEQVPALHDEGACEPSRREANRVREEAYLLVRPLSEVEAGCWKDAVGADEAQTQAGGDGATQRGSRRCHDDCDDPQPGPAGICLEPKCPCGECCVPLALITPDPTTGFTIDTRGRRELPTPPEFLTHVVGINWPHGGAVSISDLGGKKMNGRLVVEFDRKLAAPEGKATGINEHTFLVQYHSLAQRDMEFLPWEVDQPPGVAGAPDDTQGAGDADDTGGPCRAVFTIDGNYLGKRSGLVHHIVQVTLLCDFILDCHGNPVDGEHLRARLPSGDGRPGGAFHSWFEITP